jgi:hypothetical protein
MADDYEVVYRNLLEKHPPKPAAVPAGSAAGSAGSAAGSARRR